MNAFDRDILRFLTQLANRSPTFDKLVAVIANATLLKGGVVLALVCGLWFSRSGDRRERRSLLAAAVLGTLAAVIAARALALLLPFRPRPISVVDPPLAGQWTEWSSFPSDHATLMFALTVGLGRVSRRLGAAIAIYAVVFTCLPRLYLGLHYPTDVLAGAFLGTATVVLATSRRCRRFIDGPLFDWVERSPATFYAVGFLVLYEIATLFVDLRSLAAFAWEAFS